MRTNHLHQAWKQARGGQLMPMRYHSMQFMARVRQDHQGLYIAEMWHMNDVTQRNIIPVLDSALLCEFNQRLAAAK